MSGTASNLTIVFSDIATMVGMSRPAGQCFAAIWRHAAPPCADDLVSVLGLSRSNVSTALKELRTWGLVAVERQAGDRREYFIAPDDPWEVLRLILAARQRRDLAAICDRLAGLPATAAQEGALTVAQGVSAWISALAAQDAESLNRSLTMGSPVPVAGKPKKKKKKKARE